jgi:hypothetical protein
MMGCNDEDDWKMKHGKGQRGYTLEGALGKIYTIRLNGIIKFPKVLYGKRIKILLIDDLLEYEE